MEKLFNITQNTLIKCKYIVFLYIPKGIMDKKDHCVYSLIRIIDNKKEVLLCKGSYDKEEIIKESENLKKYFNAQIIETN